MDLQGEKQAFAFKKSSAGYFNPYFKKATSAGLSTLTTLTVSTSDTISVASGRECLQRIVSSPCKITDFQHLKNFRFGRIKPNAQIRCLSGRKRSPTGQKK